jgi:hypothetical protein
MVPLKSFPRRHGSSHQDDDFKFVMKFFISKGERARSKGAKGGPCFEKTHRLVRDLILKLFDVLDVIATDTVNVTTERW